MKTLQEVLEKYDEVFYGETKPRRTAILSRDSELGDVFKSFLTHELTDLLNSLRMEVKTEASKAWKFHGYELGDWGDIMGYNSAVKELDSKINQALGK